MFLHIRTYILRWGADEWKESELSPGCGSPRVYKKPHPLMQEQIPRTCTSLPEGRKPSLEAGAAHW